MEVDSIADEKNPSETDSVHNPTVSDGGCDIEVEETIQSDEVTVTETAVADINQQEKVTTVTGSENEIPMEQETLPRAEKTNSTIETESSEIIVETSTLITSTPVENNNASFENTIEDILTEDNGIIEQDSIWPFEIREDSPLTCLAISDINEYIPGRFLKGCKWAPDGSCLLANSDDNCLRLYNFPENLCQVHNWSENIPEDKNWKSVLKVREGGQVYDYSWFPLMSSADPVSSCFLSTSRNEPMHLWDAFTGKLRCSYRAYNNVDELIAAQSIAFDPTGQNIYCGFDKTVRVFNITRPGRECSVRVLKHPAMSELSQPGIISCIAVNPTMNTVYACGSFRKTVGLYYEDGSGLPVCILEGHLGGVTHLAFSRDGTKLFSGGRKDSRLICWDMRNMGEEYTIFDRVVETNQRIYFDITSNDQYLITGGTDGILRVWDLKCTAPEPWIFPASTDCINGISINPYSPVLATSSGQRHFYDIDENPDSDEIFVESESKKNAAQDIKLWRLV